MNHFVDVRAWLARAEMQVTPGVFREMHDVVVFVQDRGRRPALFEQFHVQLAEEVCPPLLRGEGWLVRLGVVLRILESRSQWQRMRAHTEGRRPRCHLWRGQWHHRDLPGRTRHGTPHINAMPPIEGREKRVHVSRRFRAADEKHSAGPQREMENIEDLVLRLLIQINKQIAAGDEIDPRKGRIP